MNFYTSLLKNVLFIEVEAKMVRQHFVHISILMLGLIIAGFSFPAGLLAPGKDTAGRLAPRGAADAPIVVNGDAGWASVPGISGDGSEGTPYVIKDKIIDAGGTTSGIWINNTRMHFIIQNCTTYNSAGQPNGGIRLENVSLGQVIGNNCSNNAGAGILAASNCTALLIDNNAVHGNAYGIVLFQQGFNINITHNNVTRNFVGGAPGVTMAAGPFINVTIAMNNVSNNNWAGINIWTPSANVSIYDNYLENHTTYGIRLMDVNTTYVWNNTIKGNVNGIYLQSGDTLCEFRANNITGSTDGVYVGECNFSNFEDNVITGNSRGFNWIQGNNNTVRGNNISSNTLYGITFNPSGHNNSILGNEMSNNQYGIYCQTGGNPAKNNTVADNSFLGDTVWGVRLDTGNDGWLFYGNNFSSVSNALNGGLYNRWDNGSAGNFWSNYADADADDNFVGDTPQAVPGIIAYDNYPFCDDGDDVAPVVTITGLVTDQLWGGNAPSYGLAIVEAYTVEDLQVSYDGGLNNQTCAISGTLPNWGDLGNGTVTVTFFANDTKDHLGVASVTIRKDVEVPVFTATGLTAGQLCGNSTPAYVLATSEGNPSGQWWFSFDAGVTNTSCSQSGVLAWWALLPNGTITVSFFTNDTMNNVGWIDVVLRRDCLPPIISSTGLIAGASYSNVPTISLAIAEANRDTIWYSVDGGATNHTLVYLIGNIDAAVWASLSSGNVQITFWCNDTLGNTAFISVIIVKITSSECEGCGDTTLYWIIGGAIAAGVIVTVTIFVKRRKNRLFYLDETSTSK